MRWRLGKDHWAALVAVLAIVSCGTIHAAQGQYGAAPTNLEEGAWGCYEVTQDGDLILHPYPNPGLSTEGVGQSDGLEERSIFGRQGYFRVGAAGAVELEPLSGGRVAAERRCHSAGGRKPPNG
jgi:hypothetical protein